MPIKLPFRPRREPFPPDLWTQCPSCEEMLFNKQLDKLMRVCPNCGHHFRLSAQARLEQLVDPASFTERDAMLESVDPLGFVDQRPYPDRVEGAQMDTGLRDAAVWGDARIDGRRVAIAVMDFGFMGGSMGAVVGEKIARGAEYALAERVPLVTVAASGGARMQEGTLSLMQLAKTVAAVERLREAVGAVHLDPHRPDDGRRLRVVLGARGRQPRGAQRADRVCRRARVSAGTIAQELPPGFQRAEFLFERGFVDRVVPRAELRDELALLLGFLQAPEVPSNGSDNGTRRLLVPDPIRRTRAGGGPDACRRGRGPVDERDAVRRRCGGMPVRRGRRRG